MSDEWCPYTEALKLRFVEWMDEDFSGEANE
jgi:hypothetical protein